VIGFEFVRKLIDLCFDFVCDCVLSLGFGVVFELIV